MELKGKKLLILGANPETAVLVETARSMGVYTIVTDYDPNGCAKKFADKAYNVDGLDVPRLVNLAKKEEVDGVMVGVADPLILSYQQVCEALSLPCYATREQVEVFTNKYKFKRKCEEYGISGVPEYKIHPNMTQEEFDAIQYPVLLKPVDNCSGKGISVCYDSSTMLAAFEKALSFSPSKKIIAEKYMTCLDMGIYYTFKDGEVYLSTINDRYTCDEQPGVSPVCVGGIYPSRLADGFIRDEHPKFCRMFRDLNVRNGVLHISAFCDNGKVCVYDPGFRLLGGGLHLIINATNGFDQRKMLVNLALTGSMGDEDLATMNDPYLKGQSAAVVWFLLKEGMIKEVRGMDYVRSHPDVVYVLQRFEGGEAITRDMVGTERQVFARLFVVSPSRERLKETVINLKNAVKVADQDDHNMLLKGLNIERVFG